ncbi:hypothetical protein GCM10027167_48120 [Nocardia heshunensis]
MRTCTMRAIIGITGLWIAVIAAGTGPWSTVLARADSDFHWYGHYYGEGKCEQRKRELLGDGEVHDAYCSPESVALDSGPGLSAGSGSMTDGYWVLWVK